jgi:hypothetical protein
MSSPWSCTINNRQFTLQDLEIIHSPPLTMNELWDQAKVGLIKPYLAATHSPAGDRMGDIVVPVNFFNRSIKWLGEFVLLSPNALKKSNKVCKGVPRTEKLDCGAIRHARG